METNKNKKIISLYGNLICINLILFRLKKFHNKIVKMLKLHFRPLKKTAYNEFKIV